VIIARTAGSILSQPLIIAALFAAVNIVILVITKAGYTVLPSHYYLIFINLLMLVIILSSLFLTRERAKQKSNELCELPPDEILENDTRNVELRYSDIKEINISKSVMKIFTNSQCLKTGRIMSRNYLNRMQTLPISVTIGEKT
jgi:hypothetical protein